MSWIYGTELTVLIPTIILVSSDLSSLHLSPVQDNGIHIGIITMLFAAEIGE
jgi:hypothetical protein